jgi:hypothetical protein
MFLPHGTINLSTLDFRYDGETINLTEWDSEDSMIGLMRRIDTIKDDTFKVVRGVSEDTKGQAMNFYHDQTGRKMGYWKFLQVAKLTDREAIEHWSVLTGKKRLSIGTFK